MRPQTYFPYSVINALHLQSIFDRSFWYIEGRENILREDYYNVFYSIINHGAWTLAETEQRQSIKEAPLTQDVWTIENGMPVVKMT